MNSVIRTRLVGVILWLLFATVIAVQLWVVIPGVFVMRLWEDEAFNLTVPLNLLAGHGYTSDGTLSGSALSTFDPRISTGPVVLLPITLVIALGADPVIGGRLVILGFYIALLAGLWILGNRIGGRGTTTGRLAGLIAVCVPLGWNTWASASPIQSPVDILGEVPSAALLIWAIVVFKERPWLAGLFIGLAMQTKLVAALGAPAIAVGVFLTSTGAFWPRAKRVLLCAVVAVVPSALYELWKLVTLGPAGYWSNLREFYWFFKTGGQKITPVPPAAKADALFTTWFSPIWLTVLCFVIVLVVFVLVVWRVIRAVRVAGVRPAEVVARERIALGLVAVVGVLTWSAWWMISRGTPVWPRHPSPGIYTFVPILAALAVAGIVCLWQRQRRTTAARALAVSAAVVLVATVSLQLWGRAQIADQSRYGEDLADQRAAASAISDLDDNKLVSAWGPEVSVVVLSGAHAGLTDVPRLYGTPQLWRNYDSTAAGRQTFQDRLTARCSDVPVREGPYAVCLPKG
ncbi:hypothetical protein SAMN04489806_2177 [Paramicrobacterium humi]|uniref:4-amino-4-deoxy-L-arabinose transferase n=2 Tax=Paramicrobacterium humi TaxID=640635 RepID=A0A1H4NFB6_9MICO|nr:hypothetical protein SAMN04489806_2177 [Microbacterium humi]